MTTPTMLNFHEENFLKRLLIREIRENVLPRKFPTIQYTKSFAGFNITNREGLTKCTKLNPSRKFKRILYSCNMYLESRNCENFPFYGISTIVHLCCWLMHISLVHLVRYLRIQLEEGSYVDCLDYIFMLPFKSVRLLNKIFTLGLLHKYVQ